MPSAPSFSEVGPPDNPNVSSGVAQLVSSWVRSTRNSGRTSNQRMTSFPFERQLSVSCAFGTQLLRSWATRRTPVSSGVAQLDSSWVRSTRNSGRTSNQRMTSFPFERQLSVSCAFGTQLLRSWATRRTLVSSGVAQLVSSWVRSTRNSGHTSNQ